MEMVLRIHMKNEPLILLRKNQIYMTNRKWYSDCFNPIPGGAFEVFFIFEHAFEDMTWKHATNSLHNHFRSG